MTKTTAPGNSLALKMRRTSDTEGNFPYGWPGRVCYMEITSYHIVQLRTRADMREAIYRAQVGQSRIIAAWPGEWRTDVFEIDDINALALAVKA